MKSFDKIKILDNINNIEIKKTINKFLDGLVSMEKNYKEVFVSNFFTPLEFKYIERILKNLDLDYDIIFAGEDYERKFKGTYDKRNSEIKWKYINRTARDGESFKRKRSRCGNSDSWKLSHSWMCCM